MVFDPPKKFLSDNGGEFANELFLELAESLSIRVLNTVAESPWSNGLVERHNGILREMLEKIMEECSDLLQLSPELFKQKMPWQMYMDFLQLS